MPEVRWLPLESNPDVMNRYVRALGLSADSQFVDVWGMQPDMLSMVPRPVLSVLLLYPLNKASEDAPLGEERAVDGAYFIKQTIGNACGTVGLIHALCNNTANVKFEPDKHIGKFYAATKGLSPTERGHYLENDMAFTAAHEESAQEGQTEAPSRNKKLDLHFVAFVHHEGYLLEMDGRRDNPICHGETTKDSLLEDTAAVVQKFMSRDPDNLNFTLVALTVQD